MVMEYEIEIYATDKGKEPFKEWLDRLKNSDTQALVFQRLQRIRLGNFGDCKSVDDGLWEFRIHAKSGLRIYYARIGRKVILVIGGGNKDTQPRDIMRAKEYLKEYKRRML